MYLKKVISSNLYELQSIQKTTICKNVIHRPGQSQGLLYKDEHD